MTVAHADLRPHWRSRLRVRLRNGRLAMLLGVSLLGGWLLLALF
ncbi:ABC transporter permease, partial [Pseudomonas syringae]|nr:ABC transporter permease [Pseudomonas syringae]